MYTAHNEHPPLKSPRETSTGGVGSAFPFLLIYSISDRYTLTNVSAIIEVTSVLSV